VHQLSEHLSTIGVKSIGQPPDPGKEPIDQPDPTLCPLRVEIDESLGNRAVPLAKIFAWLPPSEFDLQMRIWQKHPLIDPLPALLTAIVHHLSRMSRCPPHNFGKAHLASP